MSELERGSTGNCARNWNWTILSNDISTKSETHKIHWGIKIQTDPVIPTRRPDLVIMTPPPKKKGIVHFAVPVNHTKVWRKQKRLCQRTKKKADEYECDGDTNSNWCTWNVPQTLHKETRRAGNLRMRRSWDHPNYSIANIGLNTEKSPRVLRRLTVIQTPVKDHQLMLVCKRITTTTTTTTNNNNDYNDN